MASAMNGMALHGGVIPYGGTFLCFADYSRPAIRLAALMGARVVHVMTHDSIGLGEDGPTHQPVEHLAALYQINQPGPHQPYYVANLRFKSRTGKDPFDVDIDPETNLQSELPTGTGFLAFQPSLTVIYPSDPAVFFGNLSYTWQKKRHVGQGFGTVDPGDSVGASVGMGLALNDRASFSIGYEHNTVLRTKQNREPLIDSRTLQIGTLNLGASYRLSNRTMLNLSLNFGVTEEAPDVQAVLRMPMSF
jgi:hypothetical protein